jgi:hypothetical protein
MFNKDFFILLLLVFFIYFLGDLTLSLLAGRFVKKINLFLRLAFNWLIGNSIFVFTLHFLFFINRLDWLQLKNFLVALGFILLLKIALSIKNKDYVNVDFVNWVYLLLILVFFIPLMIESLTSFLIGWDAVAMWFFKAKAIFYDHFDQYLKSSDYLFSSKAYPIGISLVIASYARLIKFFNDQTIQFYFLLYYLNLVFLSFGLLLYFFKEKIHRFILLLIVFSFYTATNFVVYSHNGYVDLILAFVITSIFVLLYFLFEEREFKKGELLRLTTIGSGFSLTIKNEAVPFVFFIFLSLLVFAFYKKIKINRQKVLPQLMILFISFLPFILWQRYIRLNQVASFLDGHYLDFLKVENLKRIKLISNYLFIELLNTNKYNLSLIPLILLFVYSLFRLILDRRFTFTSLLLILIFFGQLISYVFIYVITPLPFVIQLETSLERVILQILPIFFTLTVIFVKIIYNKKNSN